MPHTRIPEAMDALYAFVAGAVGTDVTVERVPTLSQTYPAKAVYVGFAGDAEGASHTASSKQSWAGLGAKQKNEVISIPTTIQVNSGGTDTAAVRDDAFAILEQIEAALIADPSMGMAPTVVDAGVSEIAYALDLNEEGIGAVITFVIDAFVRIR